MTELALDAPSLDVHPRGNLSVRCEHVSKAFRSGQQTIRAVDDVSLTVSNGEFLAIMGPSGSGKSTLIYLLAGLTKADAGLLEVAGLPLRAPSERQLAKHRRTEVGLVFQSSNLLPRLTLGENVELPLMLSGQRPVRGQVNDILSTLGLLDRRNHLPNELSGGEQQRAALARALVHSPGLILADEPTGSLDSENTHRLCELLSQVRDQGRTVIVTTHNSEVAAYADRLIVMRDGRITERLS